MTLRLKTKSVRFELTDEDAETVVTLSSDDDQETLVRKLRRVIALVEGEPSGPQSTFLVDGSLNPAVKTYGPVVGTGALPQPTNGWAAMYGPPALPERLEGEVELVQPGEDA
ncbi:hypothetical protein ACFPM3_20305 [Streptomyces coeruleoprunus]|uniref:Uncharacterized protein n=1 Tax=Streptomyces coeruleoprunus TaxID=285563 RepID=A0ABV9XJV4_9ACTN